MRVLCVNDLPPGAASSGGVEVHLGLLIDGLRATGDDVRAFSRPPRTGAGRLADTWDPSARAALERAVEAFRPDVLHFHNVVRELSVAVLGASPGLARVLTVHDGRLLGDADGQHGLLRALQHRRGRWDGWVARRAGATVLAVSGPLQERLQQAGFTRVERAWPWAAPPVAPLRPATASRDIAFVGRLDPDKGVDVLVEAFLRADRPGSRLLLAGRGSLRQPADDRVVLLGTLDRTEISALLGSVRAVALPSLPGRRPEGAPLALVEALVHGRPLLVSDDPGCLEIARIGTDSPAGIAVPAGDVAALAISLGRLLDDDALVTDLSAGAVQAAVDHSAEAGLARVRAAYADARR